MRTLTRARPFVIITAAALAGACSSEPRLPQPQCHARGATAQLGQKATDATIAEALRNSGALRSRVLPYGARVSGGEADPLRLNIEVDGEQVIQRMRCG